VEIARGLRECELQTQGIVSATSTLPLGALSSGATPAVVDTDVKSAVLSQTVERSRRASEEATPEPAPARGLSRTFDSLEATQRLVALGDATRGADPSASTMPLTMQTTVAHAGAWRLRDTFVVAAGALAGLVAAAVIVLV
jgi:hypothetical protein